MEVSVEVHKISKCAIYNTAFFPSGGGVDDVLVRLLLVKQIIKDVNFMCQTSTYVLGIMNEFVQYVQNISNIYTYPFNPEMVIKT